MNKQQKWPYEDIVDLPHHVSPTRPQMSRADRAAQFSSFAALTGHDAAVRETARRTASRIDTAEDKRQELDLKQQLLAQVLPSLPELTVTYFVPDTRKAGGAYVSAGGRLKRIDSRRRILVLDDGTEIPADDVLELESPIFTSLFRT
ncbi:MAG: hypothetical protein IJA67_04880 [Oscillospiraceae bacterium]|nr:hypothetical protein [Oscillospiraceae bacterium]